MFPGPVGPVEVFSLLALSHFGNFLLVWGYRTTVGVEPCISISSVRPFVLYASNFDGLPVFCMSGKIPVLNVSYKPQKISPKSRGSVRQLLHEKIRDSYIHPQFVTDVIKPLHMEALYDQEVRKEF